ncbi:MAG: bacteriohopanetetrol glucosamine biosynthesis glycosyltransferase HpnI [Steroidobacterales bacterium]
MPLIHPLITLIGLASLAVAAGYAVLALLAVLVWQRRPAPAISTGLPAVTLLKPLCGAEPGLYDNLRSFCRQHHPQFQLVFGVRDPADPALAVVQRLMVEFPSLPIDVVVNPQQHGSNAKISNLINIFARARHDVLVIADSDACVEPDYLNAVTAPLMNRDIGLVTCLYRGMPTRRIGSRLGAMYVDEWYMPSVLLAWLCGYEGYASGQTLCLRRDTLQAIGGLQAIANHLADDHRMGELVRELGLRIVLSPYLVRAEHNEPDLGSLIRHEVRWMRTIHVLRPRSFRMIFLSFSVPLAILGLLLMATGQSVSTTGWVLFGATLIARLGLYFVHRWHGDRPLLADLWLLPARELLLCWVWFRSFFTSRVTWRGNEFDVDADGIMRRLS